MGAGPFYMALFGLCRLGQVKATQWDAVAHWGGNYLTMWKVIVFFNIATTLGAYVVVPMIDRRLKSIFAMHEHPKEGGIL